MRTPLLQTKLTVPPPRAELVPRQRLNDLLDESLDRKLTLISAPPGFGKTTLVGNWIRQRESSGSSSEGIEHSAGKTRTAWLSLDVEDSDPERFWRYVIAALRAGDIDVGEDLSEALEATQPPSNETILTLLINQLDTPQSTSAGIPPDVLVLDDYHQITSDEIHEGLNFLIDHQPRTLHVVIATRSDPPLHLPLRQGRGEVTQIRASDLSFSREESELFLNSSMGLGLSAPDIAALEGRTEGWIAGLQLAALSLQNQEDKHAFVSGFAGDNRYIADYLVDEVLRAQPQHVQDFLLHTSVLDRLSAPLCEAITGRSESRAILVSLEQGNLFLAPLDTQREWYRYHQLFKDLLDERLRHSIGPSEVKKLHERAYDWYLTRGDLIEAIEHALSAADFHRVADLIEEHAQEVFAQHRLNTLSRWLASLPDEILGKRPVLNTILAWALVATGRFDEAENAAKAIEKSVGVRVEEVQPEGWLELDTSVRSVLIEATVIRSVIAINAFDIPSTIKLSQLVSPYLRDDSQLFAFNQPKDLRTVVAFNTGIAYELTGDGAKAERSLVEAVDLSIETSNFNVLPAAIAHLAQLQVIRGYLHEAGATYERAIRMSAEHSEWPSPLTASAHIGLGRLRYEWNDLDRARAQITAGMELAERWNLAEGFVAGYVGLAKLYQAQGDREAAIGALDEAVHRLSQPNTAVFLPAVKAYRARLWIDQGNLTAATRWKRESNLDTNAEPQFMSEVDNLVLARLLLAQESWEAASEYISRLLAFAEEGERYGRVIEMHILRSLALEGLTDVSGADGALSKALTLAEPHGYTRLFVDERSQLAGPLYRIAAGEVQSNYANQLLDVINAEGLLPSDLATEPVGKQARYVEPLSDREIEVLECISEGLSNREIGQRLSISLSTVKTHTRNIYGKLDVKNRTQAVAKSRALGILAS